MADLIAVALSVAAIAKRPSRIAWWPYNLGPLLLYFAMAVASLVGTQETFLGAFSLWKIVRGIALYWCVVNTIRTGVDVRAFWRAAVALGLMLAVIAAKQKYLGGYYRVPTIYDHENTVALVLNPIAPVLLAFGLVDQNPRRAMLSMVAALAMLFTVVETFSRAGMVLGLVALLAVLGIAQRRARSMRTRVAGIVVVIGLALGGAVLAKSVIERFEEAPEASALARGEFNRVAARMAADYPLGVGINLYSAVASENPRYHDEFKIMANEDQTGVCHHIYRLTAAEMGWYGLAVFVFVLLRFVLRTAATAWRRKQPDGLIQFGFLAGAVALHLSGFFEWAFRLTAVFYPFLVCAGVSMGMADLARDEERQQARDRRAAREASAAADVTG
jgi:hypothetical protein